MKFEHNYSIAYFKRRKSIWYALETILLTLLALLIAKWLSPEDPYSLVGPISWLVGIPIFCSLLYGALNGIISLSILLLYLMFYRYMYNVDVEVIRHYSVGISCFTLISGVFSSYWLSRIAHVEHLNRYVREHLEDLSRDYYQLKISHERIEHAYIMKPLSFRDAFIKIRDALLKNNGDINEDICQKLLNIFCQYCSINNAVMGLYSAQQNTFKPKAFLGKTFSVNMEDSLIQKALKKHTASYIALNTLSAQTKSDYIAVLPLLNKHLKPRGFIIIKDMPFWSLNHDNFEVLNVFAATFALHWIVMKKVEPLLEIFPTCPPEFMRELYNLIELKKMHQVESALVGLIIPSNTKQENIIYSLEHSRRSMDYTWILPLDKSQLYLVLLPLTGYAGLLGYQKRLFNCLKSEFGVTLNEGGYRFRYQVLNKNEVNDQLNDFIQECSYELS